MASHGNEKVNKEVSKAGNKSAPEMNKKLEESSRQVQGEVSKCSEQETPNSNESRLSKGQVWISDPNEDDSNSELGTDVGNSNASTLGRNDREVLNQESVGVNNLNSRSETDPKAQESTQNLTSGWRHNTENDRSEGELSDSSSDEFDSENVDSLLEETLRRSRQHSFEKDYDRSFPCDKNVDDMNHHRVMSGKGDVFMDPPRSPSPFNERHESHKRKRKHYSPEESRHKRQRSKSPPRSSRESGHARHGSSRRHLSVSSSGSRSSNRSISRSRSRSRSPPEISLLPSEKSGSFLRDARTYGQTLGELIQKAQKVPRQVKLK